MSTKIWTAWRFPIERLREFQDSVRPQMFGWVIEEVEHLMRCVTDEHVASKMAEYRKDGVWTGAFSEADTERGIRVRATVKLAQRARDEYGAWMLTLDCGFNVWLHEGLCYVIPWGMPNRHESLSLPDWAEDYHYQNSTDKPRHISKAKWEERAQTWDVVALDNWNAHRLVFKVVDMSMDGLGASEIELHFLRQAAANKAAANR